MSWLNSAQTQTLIAAFAPEGDALRFVGGCVRDLQLGITVSDIDAATTLTPDEVIELLESEGIKAIPTGIDHGTITAVIDKQHFEITTLRKDTACDGRHATVEYTDNWQEDAARRDFTINALYMSPNGKLFDYFGGVEDVKAHRVRFIGSAPARIKEDYLRILRFFRFYAHFGRGEPDAEALEACGFLAKGMETLSGERIQNEMLKLLAAPNPQESLRWMEKTGVAEQLFGEKIQPGVFANLTLMESTGKEKLGVPARLAVLLSGLKDFDEAMHRASVHWRLPNKFAEKVRLIHETATQLQKAKAPAERKKIFRKLWKETFAQSVMVAALNDPSQLAILKDMQGWNIPSFPLSGEDLKSLGVPQGKPLGELLQALENAWEAADYSLSREQLLASAKEQL